MILKSVKSVRKFLTLLIFRFGWFTTRATKKKRQIKAPVFSFCSVVVWGWLLRLLLFMLTLSPLKATVLIQVNRRKGINICF